MERRLSAAVLRARAYLLCEEANGKMMIDVVTEVRFFAYIYVYILYSEYNRAGYRQIENERAMERGMQRFIEYGQ
jgi:hypothetical protein